jgi:hypothetical protein
MVIALGEEDLAGYIIVSKFLELHFDLGWPVSIVVGCGDYFIVDLLRVPSFHP